MESGPGPESEGWWRLWSGLSLGDWWRLWSGLESEGSCGGYGPDWSLRDWWRLWSGLESEGSVAALVGLEF